MSDKEVVETVYGKRHKYEIVKSPGGLLTSATTSIYRDGQYHEFILVTQGRCRGSQQGGLAAAIRTSPTIPDWLRRTRHPSEADFDAGRGGDG